MIKVYAFSLCAAAVVVAATSSVEAAPRGSYLETCRRVDQRGPILTAICLNRFGEWARTSLDLRSCGYSDIANRNGRLVCGGGRRWR
jgi:hypothetical protein